MRRLWVRFERARRPTMRHAAGRGRAEERRQAEARADQGVARTRFSVARLVRPVNVPLEMYKRAVSLCEGGFELDEGKAAVNAARGRRGARWRVAAWL
jgi:hypothetical protein